MKYIFLFFALLLCVDASAQHFQQYNTGTLYGSFENPSQSAFIPDSSRQFASNFFIPNFYANAYLQGNAQATLKSRLFLGNYDNTNLQIGQGKINPVHANVNIYLFMLKVFSSLNGKQEIGISYQARGDARGGVTDETVAFFNGSQSFTQQHYSDIFNSHASYELYHQFSATYREQITKDFSFGIKLSGLLGVAYNKVDITSSSLDFLNNANGTVSNTNAALSLAGSFRSNYALGDFHAKQQIENLHNPGAALSLGFTYITPDGIILQANLRDLGFIRWGGSDSFIDYFDSSNPATVRGLTSGRRETNVSNALSTILSNGVGQHGFVEPITGYAEISAAKKFALGENLIYTPTLIASRQTFSSNLGGALVNNLQYGIVSASLSGIYNYSSFDAGLQLMVKTPNVEFFVGSEQLGRSLNFISAAGKNLSAITSTGSYSGGGVYLGFSLKLGRVMHRWYNEGYSLSGGELGPLGKAWTKAFNTH